MINSHVCFNSTKLFAEFLYVVENLGKIRKLYFIYEAEFFHFYSSTFASVASVYRKIFRHFSGKKKL